MIGAGVHSFSLPLSSPFFCKSRGNFPTALSCVLFVPPEVFAYIYVVISPSKMSSQVSALLSMHGQARRTVGIQPLIRVMIALSIGNSQPQ